MKLRQPIWPRFLATETVLNLATLGPVGRRLPAPGTWGSVAGLLYFAVIFYPVSDFSLILLSVGGSYLSIALCGEAEFRLARKDPGEVILDEFVAMPLCFIHWRSLPGPLPAWSIFFLGLGLFRLFDILKPFGIRRVENLPGGWGVTLDDTLAALMACATMHALKYLWVFMHH